MSKIFETKNYDKFIHAKENRTVSRHPILMKSMKLNGFLSCFPLLVESEPSGKLKIIDGQHRFETAKELGIPVKYVISQVGNLDIPLLNNAQKRWSPRDFVNSFVTQGNPEYVKLKEFCDKYGISISIGASLLSGLVLAGGDTSGTGIKNGTFKVRDSVTATKTMEIVSVARESVEIANTRLFIDCVARCLLIPKFDSARFLHVIQKNPLAFRPQATIEQTLQMFEDAYNHSHRDPIPLKFMAQNLIKARKENASRTVQIPLSAA